MDTERSQPSSARRLLFFGTLLTALFAVLMALGNWQVHRLNWKRGLLQQLAQYRTAAPVPAPPRSAWPTVGKNDEYRPVFADGIFLHARESCVLAVTELGRGYWVITPLQHADGTVTLINRGFVDTEQCDPETRTRGQIEGPTRVSGRLRLSEPKGGFLRDNRPALDRWYSRDVQQIAQARQLDPAHLAPYFIDAADAVEGGPVGGLTVMRLRNHHLGYALTWFSLAALVALAGVLIARREWRLRQA